MLAKNDTDFQEAITTTYHLSQNEKIRMQCEAREDFYRRTRGKERLLNKALLENKQLTSEKEQLASKNKQLTSEIAKKDAALADKDAALADRDAKIRLLSQQLADLGIHMDGVE